MKKSSRKAPRNSVIHSLVISGLLGTLTSRIFAPKKGKGAKYNRSKFKKDFEE